MRAHLHCGCGKKQVHGTYTLDLAEEKLAALCCTAALLIAWGAAKPQRALAPNVCPFGFDMECLAFPNPRTVHSPLSPVAYEMPLPASLPALPSFRKQQLLVELYVELSDLAARPNCAPAPACAMHSLTASS